MDYLFDQWIYRLTLGTAKTKNISQTDLDVEIDARFALVPQYTGLKHFKEGMLSQEYHWTVHEIKEMMRVMMPGYVSGLCPPEGLVLLREYLHLSRLAYYSIHTEESLLQWMKSAIEIFFKILRDPDGPFAQQELIYNGGDHEPQRLHYFHHYHTAIREWGGYAFNTAPIELRYDTNLSKKVYQRSNKQTDEYIKFILKEQTTLSAFPEYGSQFRCNMGGGYEYWFRGGGDSGKVGGQPQGTDPLIDPQADNVARRSPYIRKHQTHPIQVTDEFK
jgi:hypothetical protein